jgi:tRNA A-37 threonylcarbamoyl transferase component Bud32
MGKLVVINLVGGNFEQGFDIALQIWTEGDRQWIASTTGKLPPAKELLEYYKSWQSRYRSHVSGRYSSRISVTGGTNTTIISDIKKASQQLKFSLNNWLKADSSFSPIREKLFQTLKDESEEIRVIFNTEHPELQRLPWHLWDDVFKRYYRAEVALSLPVKKSQIVTPTDNKVKVLAVFGRDTKINLQQDWEMLENLLSQKSNAQLIDIHKPKLEELCEQIDEHRPQILFFAGHSRSEESGDDGFIDLNDEDSITIDDLEPEIRKAVKYGLQLVIFNSCDGLGIARQLAQLEVPNIIVMREPVPDEVAQKFLQRFLEVFALGKPLHLAVRRARERINRLENKFPGATWLPMTFQNPAEPPLTWRSLGGIEIKQTSNSNAVSNGESSRENASFIPWLETSLGKSHDSVITCKNRHQNPSIHRFCIYCGAALTNLLICSKGHENATHNKFCSFCGEPLQQKSTVFTYISQPTQQQTQGTPNSNTNFSNSGSQNTQTQSISSYVQNGMILQGRYKITKILGSGGFSQTYLAEDMQRPGNPICVVKQLVIRYQDNNYLENVRRLFNTEAIVLEALGQHPQIPTLLAYFEQDKEFYLVQEYIEGHDLEQQLITGHKLRETEVIAIMYDILNLLKFVHKNNVIHRDIKPSNLIRRKDDQKLVLIDFGAVKQISSMSFEPITVAIGTHGYAPPEQWSGKPSFSSDIYAVGVICIQALTGITPIKLEQNSTTGEISWEGQAQVSREITAILNKMIRYDYRERYQSVTEVLQDLENIN